MIIVKAVARVVGVHRWVNCDIEEVMYLRYLHRHVFHIIAKKKVQSDDREIEFIQLGTKIENYLNQKYWSTAEQCCYFNHLSCEQIAKELMLAFLLDECEVNEDGCGGAIVIK